MTSKTHQILTIFQFMNSQDENLLSEFPWREVHKPVQATKKKHSKKSKRTNERKRTKKNERKKELSEEKKGKRERV